MSNPVKGKPSPTISQKGDFKSEVNFNGKTYREVGKHIIYHFSKVRRSSVDSLVDRAANGGVAGNDFRVIAKHPDRTVEIRGVDNHEITAIRLITKGGVISTTAGEFILIMNQHAYHEKK